MKNVYNPSAIRNEQIKAFKQKLFRALYIDLPASLIRDDAVSKARNVLLMGDHWQVRPGTDPLTSLSGTWPKSAWSSGQISKSGTTVTKSAGNDFPDECTGYYLKWSDGTIDVVSSRTSDSIVEVVSATAETSTAAVLYPRLNASHWFEKLNIIYVLLGDGLYAITLDTAFNGNTWRIDNLVVFQGATLVNSKSVFEEFEDNLYLRNQGGIFKIPTNGSYVTANVVIPINLACPPNTISVNTEETVLPPVTSETDLNAYGRRYIFSMMTLDGNQTANRGTGAAIIKESGTNTFPESNDFNDFKEQWRTYNFSEINGDKEVTVQSFTVSDIYSWFSLGESSFKISLNAGGLITRTIIVNFEETTYADDYNNNRISDLKGWPLVAGVIQESCRVTYPEYPEFSVVYDATNTQIHIQSGTGGVDVYSLVADATAFDLVTEGYISSITASTQSTWGVLGTRTSPAFKPPSSQFGWSHYSIFSTRMLGKPFSAFARDVQEFTWQKDLRVCAVMEIKKWSGKIIRIENSNGFFEEDDIGSYLYFQTTTGGFDYAQINTFASSTQVELDSTLGSTAVWAAIGIQTGGNEIRTITASATGGTVTAGTNFTPSDIGKILYWSSGDWGIITGATNTSVFTSVNTPGVADPGGVYGAVCDTFGRNYNDSLSDEKLEARLADFPAYNRFWSPLPNGQLMALIPGFMVVADIDETKFYYCNLNIQYQYYAGHYNAVYQYDSVKDTIKELTEMPNQLIIFCNHSTWREQINVSEGIINVNFITVLSGLGNVDKYIGISDRVGVTDYVTGQKVIVTSEPGIRIFDGYKYSENLLYDKDGYTYINTEVEQWRDEVVAYYEPNLYGLMLFATKTTDSRIQGSYGRSTEAWRLALERQQGYGFAEIDGDDFPFPQMDGSILRITSVLGSKYTVIIKFDGTLEMLCTRKLPSSETLALIYTDKETTEIDWTIALKEFTANEEHDMMKYIEEYWYFRPQYETDKDASGYDKYGFRDAQVLTSKIYIDGVATNLSSITSENPLATIYQPYKIDARRIKIEMNGTTSSIKGVGSKSLFTDLKRRDLPANAINDIALKQELAQDMLVWLTRGETPTLDRISGNDYDSFTGTTLTLTNYEGPDSKSYVEVTSTLYKYNYTAWTTTEAGWLVYESKVMSINRTISFDIYVPSGLSATTEIYMEGDSEASLSIQISTPAVIEVLSEGITIDTFNVADGMAYNKWFRIFLNKNIFNVYDSTGLVYTATLSYGPVPVVAVTDDVRIRTYASSSRKFRLHDFRIYDKILTTDQMLYLCKDIFSRKGFALLPQSTYSYVIPA